jgi:hypothetical protein
MQTYFISQILVSLAGVLNVGVFGKYLLENVETFDIDSNDLDIRAIQRNTSERINLSVPGKSLSFFFTQKWLR